MAENNKNLGKNSMKYTELVKKHLKIKVTEADAKHPAVSLTQSVKEKDKKINNDATKEATKNVEDYNKTNIKTNVSGKDNKPTATEFVPPKTNIEGASKKYHNEIEMSEDNLDLTYDMIEIPDGFKDRVKKGVEGDPTMGNGPGANTEPVWDASKEDFGKDLVKIKVNRAKDTSQDTSQDAPKGSGTNGKALGVTHNQTALAKKGSEKGATTPFTTKKKDATTESIVSGLKKLVNEDEKSVDKFYKKMNSTDDIGLSTWVKDFLHKVFNIGPSQSDAAEEETIQRIIKYLKKANLTGEDVVGIINTLEKRKKNARKMGGYFSDSKRFDAILNFLRGDTSPTNPLSFGENENNNNKIIENKMKRLKFKTPFNGMKNALNVIPETYRVDNKVFEMTDGNETYKVRWEGTLTEGKAIVLQAANQHFINEDMTKIKHLMGYKSEDTLGTVKGDARLDEDIKFKELNEKMKLMAETNDTEKKK